jgi:hypothetical protein
MWCSYQKARVIFNGNYYLGNNALYFKLKSKQCKKQPFGSILKVSEIKQSQFSDSQACLAALESITVKSSLVQDCIEALNLVGNCNKLHLRCYAEGYAHVSIHGNEMADLLAKRGTTLGTGPIEDLPIPAVNLKNTIKTHFYQPMWKNHTKCK